VTVSAVEYLHHKYIQFLFFFFLFSVFPVEWDGGFADRFLSFYVGNFLSIFLSKLKEGYLRSSSLVNVL